MDKIIEFFTPTKLIIIASVILLFYLLRRYLKGPKCNKIKDLTNHIIIVTGANQGIGLPTAKAFAKMNGTIIMACRNEEKTLPVLEKLKEETSNNNIYFMKVDLSSMSSIRSFAQEFKSKFNKLDILIHNAGLTSQQKVTTEDGFDKVLATNSISNHYLTNLLLDELKAAAPSRVICVSGYIYEASKFRPNDINIDNPSEYGFHDSYAYSKLLQAMIAQEINVRLENRHEVKAVALHPGVIPTNLIVGDDGKEPCFFKIIRPILSIFVKNVEEGSQQTIECALMPYSDLKGGKFYRDFKISEYNDHAKNSQSKSQLWNWIQNSLQEKGYRTNDW